MAYQDVNRALKVFEDGTIYTPWISHPRNGT